MRTVILLALALAGCTPALETDPARQAFLRSDLVRSCQNGDVVGYDPVTRRHVLARPTSILHDAAFAFVRPGTRLEEICA